MSDNEDRQPPIEFLDDQEIERATHALHDAIEASARRLGLGGIKAFTVAVLTDTGGVAGGMHLGCRCATCQVRLITTIAEMAGATAQLELRPAPPLQRAA